MLTSTAVVAHSARKDAAFDLAIALDASVAYDLGEHGPGSNHRRAWQLANTSAAEHIMVVEDDAVLTSGFRAKVERLLPTAPTPVVSLYLGTSYPLHLADTAARAQAAAEQHGDTWLTLDTCNHAVALVIRQDLVADMLDHTEDSTLPIDEAIGAWAAQRGHQISYPVVSLVDHTDGPTVIAHPDGLTRDRPRRAIRFEG